LVPGQRPAQLLSESHDRAGDRVANRLAPCPASEEPFFTRGPSWLSIGGT
jgi:hypothetical protein